MKLFASVLLLSTVIAHPGPDHPVSHSELQRRAAVSKRCAPQVAQFNEKRYNARLRKRALDLEERGNTTYQITTEAPYYDVIQNDTCVLTPEVTQGPYVWPRSQTLRQDMSEGEAGVPLWLDVGVIDINTCEPLPNALVSFWHCNATGSYSSFTGLSPNTPFRNLLAAMDINNFTIGETDLHTDDSTFLRGMWPTDEHGVMEMKTVFPGFYVKRAIHIHTQVFTDYTLHANGTVKTGNRVSTGQLYFPEELEAQIMALEPYASHTEIVRLKNDEDDIFDTGFAGGYNPLVSVVPADGVSVENGMIGLITMGIDPTAVEEGDVSPNIPSTYDK